MIIAIFAIDEKNGMGKNNAMPWPSNKEDMKWFKTVTTDNFVVMGRKTWDSLGKYKPLPNRTNIVISRNKIPNVITFSDNICENILNLQDRNPTKNVFIIGGLEILKLTKPIIQKIFLTKIPGVYDCDVTINLSEFLNTFTLTELLINNECNIETYETIS